VKVIPGYEEEERIVCGIDQGKQQIAEVQLLKRRDGMRKSNYWGLLILAVIVLGFPLPGAGQGKAPAGTPQVKSPAPAAAKEALPDPKAILLKMCDFLKQHPKFSFKAEVTDDRVYAGGRKLQYGLEVEAFFQRPDKLRINGDGDVESKQLFYDGKTLTLYSKNKNVYGSLKMAGNLDAALDKANKDYGLRVGLAELGTNHLAAHATQGLTNSLYVGLSKVRGVPCYHLAFDKEKVHYQIWVETGKQPLLRKVVVTQKKLPFAPQWTAYLSDWNFSPSLSAALFTFTPPAGAHKIKFLPVNKPATPAPKKAKAKQKGGKS
jgi:hypothetical protein